MSKTDLHVHSTASDGSYTPHELIDYAISKGLSSIALTDHDTVEGIKEAVEYAKLKNFIVIPGIELSTSYLGRDVHILGLNINYKDAYFLTKINEIKKIRDQRNEKMVAKLNDVGFHITNDQIIKRFKDSVITRAHYAILMVENGFTKDKDTAFKKYLNPGCPCYIPRTKISPQDAISLIHKAEGKAILAHPLLYKFTSQQLEQLVILLKECKLDGLEAIYSSNKFNDEAKMKQLAKKYGLFITGGSDFHGIAKPTLDLGIGYGDLNIPADLISNIL